MRLARSHMLPERVKLDCPGIKTLRSLTPKPFQRTRDWRRRVRMATGPIVKDLDIAEDIGTRQFACLVDAFANALFFQTTEERLGDGVVRRKLPDFVYTR